MPLLALVTILWSLLVIFWQPNKIRIARQYLDSRHAPLSLSGSCFVPLSTAFRQEKRWRLTFVECLQAEIRVGSWKLTSRFTSMQNLDVIYVITSGSHPCRNGWTFHIWSHIHAESGSDWCHICKIHVKFSARAARSLAMHVRNHMQNHI